ncbi:hypothetical protein [Amycolatopsis thermophila]|nr:hypothetical protein [Amycolatopsis thermophila]
MSVPGLNTSEFENAIRSAFADPRTAAQRAADTLDDGLAGLFSRSFGADGSDAPKRERGGYVDPSQGVGYQPDTEGSPRGGFTEELARGLGASSPPWPHDPGVGQTW